MVLRHFYSLVGIFLATMFLMSCSKKDQEPQLTNYDLVGSTYIAQTSFGAISNPQTRVYLTVQFTAPGLFSVVGLNENQLPIQAMGTFRYRAEHQGQQVIYHYWPATIPHEPTQYEGQLVLDLDRGSLTYQNLEMVRRP